MSEPRFVPLTCPRCGHDLTGRATDVLAFCAPCRVAVSISRRGLVEVDVVSVSRLPEGEGAPLALPFWLAGSTAVPAFQSARPLTLARIASRLVPRWPIEASLRLPLPLGARLGPEVISRVALLARVPPPPPDTVVQVLSVPLRFHGNRARIPLFEGTLFPEDVTEALLLMALRDAPEPARAR